MSVKEYFFSKKRSKLAKFLSLSKKNLFYRNFENCSGRIPVISVPVDWVIVYRTYRTYQVLTGILDIKHQFPYTGYLMRRKNEWVKISEDD